MPDSVPDSAASSPDVDRIDSAVPAANPSPRLRDLSWQTIGMGLLVSVVGFTSSFAIVLQGLRAAGATEAQASAGLMALLVAVGLSGIWLSMSTRMPVSVAWSTPGAALLIASGDTLSGFDTAVGAFIVCAMLLMLASVLRPLARLIEAIPASLANAMLAGILLVLCLAPVRAVALEPALAIPVLFSWWLIGRFNRLFAVPGALLVLVALVFFRGGFPSGFGGQLLSAIGPQFQWVTPRFDASAIISIAVPLFIVTMASQNIPGLAVLRANGYQAPMRPLLANTGFFSLLGSPFGSHAVNLAAITAAMCAGPDSHPDPARRYWSATVAGVGYILLGLCAAAVGLLVTQIPTVLIEAIAGLALMGAFTGALVAAFSEPGEREAAAVTFLFSGSGLALFGIGGAFWGLLAGATMIAVDRWRQAK